MRTRNADSSAKSATPKKTPPARKSATKSAGESPAAKRTPASKTRNVKKTEASPTPDPISDSNPDQSPQGQKPVKKRAPGRPRTKTVATPNLVAADETPIIDNSEVEEKVEEPGGVEIVNADNNESEKEGEQGVGSVGLSDEKEQKSMEVDEPVVKEVCESGDKGKSIVGVEEEQKSMEVDEPVVEEACESAADKGKSIMEVEKEQKSMELDEPVVEKVCESANEGKSIVDVEGTALQDASVSFKRPGRTIVDLNISVADNEDSTGAKEGEEELKELGEEKGKEELKEREGEKGKEGINEQQGEKGKEELMEQEGEKRKEDLKEQEGEKGKEDLKEQGEKVNKELKEQEGEKGTEELEKQEGEKGREELEKQEGEKGREELEKQEGEKGKEELKEQEGEKGSEELKKQGLEKEKGEETTIIGHEEQSKTESFSVEVKAQLKKDVNLEKDGDEGEKSSEKLHLGEQEREESVEEDPEEPPEETETLVEEHMELEAIAKQRKIKKEHEIFVGGLDRDATEEDLKKVFQRIGEVVEVRLHKNSSTNKNKGYAFVKFANKEHAKKALSEMKNPVINGKRCGTAPSEDNDTLFLGNICNTWTKEAIKQKLKDYGVEGVENITLVPDAQHEGLSRGFAFLEFSCHGDAMLAYKRLQKPDVIFGHTERTAKVAFAEPIREPDPEIMSQVKSVFINGLPPHWDEDHVRELLKSYGEIVRIVLARNMSTAKRKDYGFVDFSTHEAAVACVDGVNKSELGDVASKVKVRARLSNPLPKTQAVKGGMCGGFRIGHSRSGAFPRSGRGFGRGRQPFNNWGNFNRDRSFYHGGHSQIGRTGFRDDLDFNMYPDFRQRQFGPQGAMRGGHYAGSRGAAFAGPSRPYHDRAWYGIPDGAPSEPIPPRRPYSPGGQFDAPLMGRHFEDPYLYDDNMHGTKRPFYMTISLIPIPPVRPLSIRS
ncbi:RNA-binding domain superfamily [Sesbania bispinosa]|nr:RNA-binding domain superfamily [Sesbania bispinosa]